MLLCNPSRSPEQQKQLLRNVLFVDHTNPRYWNQYLTYLIEKYPQKRDSLITLVFKALSVIPEAPNKDQPDFIRLHLRLAALDQYVLCSIILLCVCFGGPERLSWFFSCFFCVFIGAFQDGAAGPGQTALQNHAEAGNRQQVCRILCAIRTVRAGAGKARDCQADFGPRSRRSCRTPTPADSRARRAEAAAVRIGCGR